MGYYSRMKGSIQIDPPLNYQELKNNGQVIDGLRDVGIVVDKEKKPTPEGLLTVFNGTHIVPRSDDSGKVYDIQEEIPLLVDMFKDDHVFNGSIRVEGEEAGDIWRMRVKDNEIFCEKAKLLWPDGATEDSR